METLKIADLYGCKKAILKEGSPSCGSSLIYDGTFTGKKSIWSRSNNSVA